MDTAKYIIVKEMEAVYGTMDLVPIIFPAYIPHAEMMLKLKLTKKDIDSAGFIEARSGSGVYCYGGSEGLDIKSKPRDTDIMYRLFKGRW